ncbi:uncharacterized protein LOC118202584 [Stegodyphus dumicola]|uniref:uncharacterized protein LOC118202584 n=1 Tax=Stegodyphus dumicola TaxID=202533 RepID=UPI0015B336FF|nr:uncharacterized protein LOC118202584 [Stegodyphus dumicola]
MDKTGEIQQENMLGEAAMMRRQSTTGINPLVFSLVDVARETNRAFMRACDKSSSEEITLSVSKDNESTTAEHGNNQHYSFSRHTSSAAKKICKFCRQNGERKQFYESHQLKDKFGNVECPVLREYVCDVCGKTGSEAHTRTYCPVLRNPGGNKFPIALKLKHTLHDSCGRIRK